MQPDSPLLILVIDDEPPVIDLLRRVGKQLFPEARFISTTSPQETLDYLEELPNAHPHMMLLDIDLHSTINGIELIPQIRSRLKYTVPIVMFSVSDAEPDIQASYEAGAVAYTKKPEDMEGWRNYVSMLKQYWYNTNLLPGVNPV